MRTITPEDVNMLTTHTVNTGIGLRQPHYREFVATRPPLSFVEVHSENFMNSPAAKRMAL